MRRKFRGITFGAFDLLHAGHALFLKTAGQLCDELIIGLHIDPSIERRFKNKPIQSATERYYQLAAIEKVKSIIPYETEKDLCNIIAATTPLHFYFVGNDHKNDIFPPPLNTIIQKRNIQLMFIGREHDYSTTELRKRMKDTND